jgi:gliding motility-associated-like protein
MKIFTSLFLAVLCSQVLCSQFVFAQNIGSIVNFNSNLLYTDITNIFNASLVQASNLQPTSPAINGLIQPTGMSVYNGLLYISQRNNPTKIYNSAYNNVGNLTINFSANAVPNPLGVTSNADLIAFIPNTNQAYILRRRNDAGGIGGDVSLVTFNSTTSAASTGISNHTSFGGVPPSSLTFDNNFVYVTSNRNLQQGNIIVLRRDNLTEVTRCAIVGFNPRHIIIHNSNLIIGMDNSSVGTGSSGSASTEGRIRTVKLTTILSGSCCPDYNDIPLPLPTCAPFLGGFFINSAGNQLTNILTNGCVIASLAYNPTPFSALTTTISPLQRICQTQSTPLLATGGTSYAWTPATGLSATNIANPTASPSVTTTYSVVISNGTCQKTETVTVEVNQKPTTNFATSFSEPCETMPLITLTNSSVAAVGATYLWNFGNGQTSTAQVPTPFRYAAAGNYNITLTVRNANGCETTRTNSITVVAGTPLTTTISPLQRICETISTPLLATGGTSYTWTPATGLSATNIANPTASPSVTTTYSVVISNSICQKTETVTVEVNQKPTANFASSFSEPCETMPLITLTNSSVAAAGATYLWDFGNGQTSTAQVPAPFRYAAAGNYNITLTVRNANGCETTRTSPITVVAGTPLTTTISPLQRICETISTPLLATGGTSYAWTPATGLSATNIANPTANPSVTTTYSVVISNSICQKTETVTVEVNQKPTANFATALTETCANTALVTLTNTSTTGMSYLWDFGNGQTSTAQVPAPFRYATAGNYNITLTVRNANGCETTRTSPITVVAGTPLTTTISPLQRICETISTPLLATGGTSYAWTPATGLSATNIANPTANPSVTTTYSVVISNSICQKTETVTVEVNQKPTANFATALTETCANTALVTLTNTSTTGMSYLWDFGNGQTSTAQVPAPFRYATAGNYNITLTVRNANGCEATRTNSITVVAGSGTLTTTISPLQRICETTSTPLLATGGTSYAWTPATGLSATNIANPTANPSVTTTYSVVISNGVCQKTETVTVEVNQKPTANFATALTETCANTALVTLTNTSTTGMSYLWDFGNGITSTSQVPTPFRYTVAGTYKISLVVKNAANCETMTSQNIIIPAIATLNTTISPKQTLCFGAKAQLVATGGTSYTWTPATGLSAANIANPIANPSVTTTYSVKIVNGTCEKTETVLVEVSATQTTFELKAMAECGENGRVVFVNKVTDAKNYTWFLADGTEITKNAQEFDKSGEYELRLEFFNGTCRQSQIQKIKVETIKPANVITPNGDGKNDKFVLDILNSGWKFEIYNRFGTLLFKTDNYQNDWGTDADNGNYYYLLTSPNGKTCRGWIQVLRGE